MICSRLRLIFLAFGLVLMSGAALADWELEIFVDKGLRPHASNPNYVEYRFVKINAAVWGCDGYHCPCGSSACPTGWSPIVPCVVGTCPMGPAQGYERCIGDNPNDQMFSCMDVIAACFVIDMTQGDCHSAFEHMFDDVWNGYDPTTGRTRIGFPPHKPRIKLEVCKDYEYFDDEWLPSYGDTLCFKVTVSTPMELLVQLNTSTYEGIAMNAPVPGWDTDTTSDIVPIDVEGGFRLVHSLYVGDRSYFRMRAQAIPTMPWYLYFRVQDYAADAYLSAEQQNEYIAQASEEIPRNFQRLLNSADSDSDGFTAWEEYRGFQRTESPYVTSHIGARPGGAMDTTIAELFVGDPDDAIPGNAWSFLQNVTLTSIWDLDDEYSSVTFPIPGSQRFYYYLDYMSNVYDEMQWANNGLCTPLGLENLPLNIYRQPVMRADQGIVRIIESTETVGNPDSGWTKGVTLQMGDTVIFGGDTNIVFYRGPAGCEGITIYFGSIETLIDYYIEHRNLDSVAQAEQVRTITTRRTIAHEFGHALGIGHHSPWLYGGYHDCFMRYLNPEVAEDFPSTEEGWEIWIARGPGIGYGLTNQGDCAYDCRIERGLRPTGPTFP